MKRGVKVALLLALGGGLLLGLAPGLAERRMNRVTDRSIEVSDHARKIHASLFVADLHADTTLWNRNVLVRGSRGHVDVPRKHRVPRRSESHSSVPPIAPPHP